MAFPKAPKFGERRMMERRQPETHFDAMGGFGRSALPLEHPLPTATFVAPNHIGNTPRIMYIFNHEKFHNDAGSSRAGSQKDVEALRKTFEKLQCHVEVISDPTLAEVKAKIHEIERRNFGPQSALIIVFLSHGGENEMIMASDNKEYSLNKDVLLPLFQNETLQGKPKILIAQACKGELEADAAPMKLIPNEYVKCFSSTEGFKSYRRPSEGSLYIQTLCKCMEEHANEKDFLSIMDEVNLKVDKDSSAKGYRQLPCYTKAISKEYYFK